MIGWIAWNMAWASAAMLLVLALRRPAARLFGAGIAYALWLLVPLRLLAPPLPQSAAVPTWSPPLDLVVAVERAASPAPAAAAGWLPWLVALWAAGAGAFLLLQWFAYRAFLARLSRDCRSLGVHGGLPLVECRSVEGPLAIGLLDRRIVLPEDFARRYTAEERRLALDHELVHHRRGDIWWNLAALLVLALNWFNPLAWISFRAFRADQELACDAAVAAAAGPAERRDYAHALVKSASRPAMLAVCPLNRADQLKRRLKMMNDHRTSRLRTLAGGAAILVLAGLGAGVGAPGLAHPHPQGEGEAKERRIVIVETKAHEGAGEDRVRQFRLRRGENGEVVLPERCNDGQELANVDERTGDERTRVILCTRGEADAATRLEQLQQVRERMAGNSELSAEHRDRVLAAIDREIVRLRGR